MRYVQPYIPRSGSWLLTLALDGLAGRPRECFQAQHFARLEGTTPLAYLVRCLQTSTLNACSGFRIHWQEWSAMPGRLGLALPRDVHTLLGEPCYVWTVRRHKLRQALSYVRALQTRVWHKFKGQAPLPDTVTPVYDRKQIDLALQLLAREEQQWRSFFASVGVVPYEVIYEDFVANYEPTVRGVLDFLGLPHATVQVRPTRREKQSDEVTEEWLRRYEQEKETP